MATMMTDVSEYMKAMMMTVAAQEKYIVLWEYAVTSSYYYFL